MRGALLLVPLLIAPVLAQERSVAAEDRVFVELSADRDACFVHETLTLRLRVGFDRDWFRSHSVPLFQQPTQAPLQVLAPWWVEGPPDLGVAPAQKAFARAGETAAPVADRITMALDEQVVAVPSLPDTVRDGRTYTVIEVERTYRPMKGGDLVVPAPRVRFAYGTKFTDDIVNGRLAADRRDVTVEGRPLTLHVKPLPDDGRPAGFSGAVGRFTASAALVPSFPPRGDDSLTLSLQIDGDGNLDLVEPPRLDNLAGFHTLGWTTVGKRPTRADSLEAFYDLSPDSPAVTSVPAIPFSYFDPGPPAGYRTIATKPIPLNPGATPEPPAAAPADEPSASRSRLPWVIALSLAAAFVASEFLRRALARRRRAGADQGAVAAFRRDAARPGADLGNALTGYLAARLGCPPAAVVSSDLAARLTAAGVAPGLASRTAALLDASVAARYGGGSAPGLEPAEVSKLVDELEQSLRSGVKR